MIERTRPFLEEVFALDQKRIAIVSHGMIGRVMVSILLGHSPGEMFRYGQRNDTIFHLTELHDGFNARHFVGGIGPHSGLPERNY